jgi:hypothetical protein
VEDSKKKRTSLRNNSSISIGYNVDDQSICEILGTNSKNITVADYNYFNIPACIFVDNQPLYPSKYQSFTSGVCHYHSKTPPKTGVEKLFDQTWDLDVKEMKANIKYENLLKYDVKGRKREPDQYTVMGESAKRHAGKCIDAELISIKDDVNVDWHWCHLIAFNMLPSDKAQVKKNLVCGTSAFNGQMMNVESAVKDFIYKYEHQLRIEVTVEIVVDTHLANHLRYRIFDYKTKLIYDEIYNPLTITFSDILDKETILQRMVKRFIR